jgi:hypothetical protein
MKAGSRKQAQLVGNIRYFSGKPCNKGHLTDRYTRNGECCLCSEIKWRSEDKSSKAERVRKSYKRHREKRIAKSVEYAKLHRQQINKQSKTCKLAWDRRNQKSRNAIEAKRRASKLCATPSWANLEAIKEIYLRCPKGFHVDHIYPLQGKNVCGLHTVENLQLLPAADNLRKSNKVT